MIDDRPDARALQRIRREALIQRGLGILALLAATVGGSWILQGRLHPIVSLGVFGAVTLAMTFFSEGRCARSEYSSERAYGAPNNELKLVPRRTSHRRLLLGGMVFGIIATIGGPGLNVLLRITSPGGASSMDLAAWVLFTLPIALAVWLLPPRGLGDGGGGHNKASHGLESFPPPRLSISDNGKCDPAGSSRSG